MTGTTGRFALASGVRDWLITRLDENDATLGFGHQWDPPMDDADGTQVTQLIYEAGNEHILLAPLTGGLFFVLDSGSDGGAYFWLVDVVKQRPEYPENPSLELRLASNYEETSRIGQRGQLGVDAALAILTEAVDTANRLLDNLDAWVAA